MSQEEKTALLHKMKAKRDALRTGDEREKRPAQTSSVWSYEPMIPDEEPAAVAATSSPEPPGVVDPPAGMDSAVQPSKPKAETVDDFDC